MRQISPYEVGSPSDNEEILRMYLNLKFHYLVKNRPLNIPILSEVNLHIPCPFIWDMF